MTIASVQRKRVLVAWMLGTCRRHVPTTNLVVHIFEETGWRQAGDRGTGGLLRLTVPQGLALRTMPRRGQAENFCQLLIGLGQLRHLHFSGPSGENKPTWVH